MIGLLATRQDLVLEKPKQRHSELVVDKGENREEQGEKMWPKEGRERQTAEVVVRLEVVMEAARSRPTGGAAVCSWKTDMIMGGEGEKDVSVKIV